MVLSPPILALLFCSTVVCGLTIAAFAVGLLAVAGWNHQSSSRRQLLRERRWFLVETSLRLIFALQLLSVRSLSPPPITSRLSSRAPCARSARSTPARSATDAAVKIAVFVLCGLWLVADRASSAAATTGLVRFKVTFSRAFLTAHRGRRRIQTPVLHTISTRTSSPRAARRSSTRRAMASVPISPVCPWDSSRVTFFGGFVVTIAVGSVGDQSATLDRRLFGSRGHARRDHHPPSSPGSRRDSTNFRPTTARCACWPGERLCGLSALPRPGDGDHRRRWQRAGVARCDGSTFTAVSVSTRNADSAQCRWSSFAVVAGIALWPIVTSGFRLEGY